MALLSLRAFTVFLHLTLTFTFFLGAIHKLHSSHHNGNEYTMAWVEVLPEGTFLMLIICYAAAISTRYFLNFYAKVHIF